MSNLAIDTGSAMRPLTLTDANEMTLLNAALHYADQGMFVFPLQRKDKKPLPGSNGCTDATTNKEVIRRWWTEMPNANIGIATGAQSGIFVLDVDGDEGCASLRHLEVENGALPVTPVAKTGRGKHILFRDNGLHRNSASVVGPKLDIRANGGYIVVPPSIHPSGQRYEWVEEGTVAEAPDWLLARMSEGRAKRNQTLTATNDIGDRIPEGSRNSALTSFTGLLRRKGIEGDELFEHVMTRNLNACDPPLDEREVERIVRSVNHYAASERRDLTDHGNALRFVALHGENLHYVSTEGIWLHWCGTHWQTIHRDVVLKLAFDVPGTILLEAATLEEGDKTATAIRRHAIATQARSKLEAIVELARPLLHIDGKRLDKNPMTLAVRNGQLDLTTGELAPHCRGDYITKLIDCDYDPSAPRQRWDQFVSEVTCGERELSEFLKRIGGYCLTGSTKEQCLFIFFGHGANGKSTIIEIWRALSDLTLPKPR